MSSRAAKLGKGASFQQAQPVSSRRAAIEAATAAPTEGAPPPTELPVTLISLNPDNPRKELGDLTDLGNSLLDHGQKTAISVMSRFAYLEGNPGREQDLEPDTKYVVIDGNSRLAAAREVGLTTIKVMVDDELGGNPDEILESALVANIHRKDLDHLDEARALEKLLKIHGTQEALAARLHRSQPWVSSRLALLKLTPDLQKRLKNGQESADLMRKVGSKKQEEQEAHLAQLKKEREEAAAARKRQREEAAARKKERTKPAEVVKGPDGGTNWATPEDFGHALLTRNPVPEPRGSGAQADAGAETGRSETEVSVESEAPEAQGERQPEPAAEPAVRPSAVVVPWDDGEAVMDLAFQKMLGVQRSRLLFRYLQNIGSGERMAQELARAVPPEDLPAAAALLRDAADALSENV
ncbi:ParB/RepB/Spo0J family partition protein [Streptomyces sp. NPDC015346]|uniref:ParB/RepB/Spo0J family partition protein n=1 Tax=Streptomyces sp. NPDC015346 TaxID=3364954 RepID=UPI0036FDBE0F